MKEYLFIGEKRSQQAIDNDWEWKQGVSTAKVLFRALREAEIEPTEQDFANLWNDEGELQIPETELKIIGMGKVVQQKLNELGIEHTGIIHPAARGSIRGKYIEHVRETLKN